MVGAGPAGASVALALLGRGMEVTVLERRPGLGSRVCGAFLDAEAIRHLDSLGLGKIVREQSVPVPSTWVSVGSGRERCVDFPMPGLALSRPDLERILLDAVKERGGKVRWGVVATAEDFRTVSVQGPGLTLEEPRTLSGDVVIWADGRFSRQDPIEKGPHAWYGWNATFSGIAQKPGEMSFFFLPNGYIGILTFKDGTSNLCGLQRRQASLLDWGAVFEETRTQSACFRRRTEGSTPVTPWRGVGPLPFTGGLGPDDGAIRVGDAAAVGDPFMGEGIGRSLGSGSLLARAWDLHPEGGDAFYTAFRHLWRSSYGGRFKLGNAFRWLLNHPLFSRPVLNLALAQPGLVQLFLPLFHGGFSTEK